MHAWPGTLRASDRRFGHKHAFLLARKHRVGEGLLELSGYDDGFVFYARDHLLIIGQARLRIGLNKEGVFALGREDLFSERQSRACQSKRHDERH